MHNPQVSIVIVSYNTRQLTLNCLNSIEKFENGHSPEYEIIVIDNASTDDTAPAIAENFPQVTLIQNHHNTGFSSANNQGIQQSRGDYILLLNSDTEFTHQDTLKLLLQTAQLHPNTGAIAPKLLNPDHTPQPSIYHFPTLRTAAQQYLLHQSATYTKYLPPQTKVSPVDVAVMAAFLIPRTTVDLIGMLDEAYFMYFEDFDYCRRLSHVGLKIYYSPEIEILHHHGASGKHSQQQMQYLTTSSKRYHGTLKYNLITSILWIGQKIYPSP